MDAPTPEPWWRIYLPSILLSAVVGFTGWSVTQHMIIRSHDQAQEVRLGQLEQRVHELESHTVADDLMRMQLVGIDAKTQLMLVEIGRVRDRLEKLEARR